MKGGNGISRFKLLDKYRGKYSKTYLQPIPMDHWIYFALSSCLYNEFVIIRIAYLLYID